MTEAAAEGKARDVVALFATCVVDVFQPDVGTATARVLRAAGCTVRFPEAQTCCGQPAWNSGFAEDAARVARTTVGALEAALDDGATAIVTPSGSCTTMVRTFWPELFELLGEHDFVARARRVGAHTFELCEFLALRELPTFALAEPATVAYHHSCHMLRELRIHDQPGALLDQVEGCRREPWDGDDRCCGFGGLFSFKLPEVSVAMADDKLTSLPGGLDGTAVEIVGADSSCLMHLRGRSRAEHQRPVATRHIAEVLAAALPEPTASRDMGPVMTGSVSRERPKVTAVHTSGNQLSGHQLGGSSLRERTATAVADPVLRARTARAVDRFAVGRVAGLTGLDDPDALRAAARAAKASVLADLPAVLEHMADAVLARGGHVCWAHTAEEANAYIAAVAAGGSVVKSKSMATEETGLNEALEAAGARVVETDLGEWIIQLAGETPSHIIAPALHHDRHSILDVFERRAGAVGVSTEPTALNAFARSRLRKEFIAADVGVTGVNFGVAESGSIVLVTNEGNGRLVSTLPRVHVAVMGMERVVATWDQLDLLLNLLTRSATGQRLTTYTNVITGPRRRGDGDGPEELHLVILDNGRSELLATEYHEMLACIRCGACLNVCPVYRQVGGHAYGWVYSGPMGAVLTPLLAAQHPEAAEVAGASTLCGACMDACPVQIPLQDLLLSLRRRRAATAPAGERAGWRAWSAAWSRTSGYEASTRAAGWARHLGRHVALLPGASRWSEGRAPTLPAARRFRDRWRAGDV